MIASDGRYPDDSAVEVRYPLTDDQDRAAWPWLPGTIMQQCGPNEWKIVIEVRELATRADGSKPRRNTPAHKLLYPACYRDASELRRVTR